MRSKFDLTVAGLTLLLLSPLLGLVALAILAERKGPVLFKQVRVGHLGRPFDIFKFRTMVVGAESLGSSVTVAGDQRVTRLGRFLRRTKLDELPQLWNVVRGEMALVGPRPEVPEIVAYYTPEMRRILTILPGLTSVASLDLFDEEGLLAGANDPDDFYIKVLVPAKVSYAMVHVDDRSFRLELATLWRTAAAALNRMLGKSSGGELMSRMRESLIAANEADYHVVEDSA
ncbi:MAG: sugar transferase [Truepera sp.]|jgi:lipopolysaccharide/colanic/teichoic acid biosynthesis glycosyltransferase|nr:sugar transferase [Truepera sp.]